MRLKDHVRVRRQRPEPGMRGRAPCTQPAKALKGGIGRAPVFPARGRADSYAGPGIALWKGSGSSRDWYSGPPGR